MMTNEQNTTTVKPGTIFVSEWGYDQTNVTFFRVKEVSKTGKTVVVEELHNRIVKNLNPMAEMVIPSEMVDTHGRNNNKKFRVKQDTNFDGTKYDYFLVNSYSIAKTWNNKPLEQNHYH